MSQVLATVEQFNAHLGLTDEDQARDALVTSLLASVQAAFTAACGRADRPMSAAAANVIEVLDGTGTATLYVDRPLAALTSVKIGPDFTAPRETLLAATVGLLVFRVGGRSIRRTDGGVFGGVDEIAALQVTYDAASEQPEDAGLAVLRGAAAVYLQRGAEDAKSETEGGYRVDMASVWEADPVWQAAVAAHRDVQVG